jgi:hypothetical protein
MEFGNVDDWRSDPQREREGAPCSIGSGRELIVRRAGSRNREYMAGVMNVAAGDVPALQRLFAETVVVGWRGIRDRQGAEIAYSPQACAQLFAQAPDLADHVARFAADRANFHAEEVAAEGESLKGTPDG